MLNNKINFLKIQTTYICYSLLYLLFYYFYLYTQQQQHIFIQVNFFFTADLLAYCDKGDQQSMVYVPTIHLIHFL